MASSPTPSPVFTPSPAPRQDPRFILGIVVIFIGFFVFLFGAMVGAVTGIANPIFAAACGFILMVAGGLVLTLSSAHKGRALPPPPPIQAPRPSGGPAGAIEIACPNCGAAPRNIDRFGIATCDYCETRFMVR